jgi:hypothetical protein
MGEGLTCIGGTGQAASPQGIAKGVDAFDAVLKATVGAIQLIPWLRIHIRLAPPTLTVIATEVIKEF